MEIKMMFWIYAEIGNGYDTKKNIISITFKIE